MTAAGRPAVMILTYAHQYTHQPVVRCQTPGFLSQNKQHCGQTSCIFALARQSRDQPTHPFSVHTGNRACSAILLGPGC